MSLLFVWWIWELRIENWEFGNLGGLIFWRSGNWERVLLGWGIKRKVGRKMCVRVQMGGKYPMTFLWLGFTVYWCFFIF